MNDIRENYKYCERIRDRLVATYEGRVKRCLECGRIAVDPDSVCQCGEMYDIGDWEPVLLLEDEYIYDVEYRIGGDFEYRNVSLMVAGGGPNIYIDTGSGNVELFWGSERATAWIPSEVTDEIDDIYREIYKSIRNSI